MDGTSSLHDYNRELLNCIEALRAKRNEVHDAIRQEEADKAKIQKELTVLTERLRQTNESLNAKIAARSEYDKTIRETDAAYMKILESAQTLLHVLRREQVNLGEKASAPYGEMTPEKMIQMARNLEKLDNLHRQ